MACPWCCSVPMECPAEIDQLINDCLCVEVDLRPTMKDVYNRLKKADQIPPPGYNKALPTPGPTPGSTPAGSRGSVRCRLSFSGGGQINMHGSPRFDTHPVEYD